MGQIVLWFNLRLKILDSFSVVLSLDINFNFWSRINIELGLIFDDFYLLKWTPVQSNNYLNHKHFLTKIYILLVVQQGVPKVLLLMTGPLRMKACSFFFLPAITPTRAGWPTEITNIPANDFCKYIMFLITVFVQFISHELKFIVKVQSDFLI